MKTIITALAAATAVAGFAAPAAAAHDYDRGRYENRWDHRDRSLDARQAEAAHRIALGLRSGALTWREAHRLRDEVRDIARLEARYRHHGLSWRERAELDRRMDRLEWSITRQSHDRDYGYGYGRRW